MYFEIVEYDSDGVTFIIREEEENKDVVIHISNGQDLLIKAVVNKEYKFKY